MCEGVTRCDSSERPMDVSISGRGLWLTAACLIAALVSLGVAVLVGSNGAPLSDALLLGGGAFAGTFMTALAAIRFAMRWGG